MTIRHSVVDRRMIRAHAIQSVFHKTDRILTPRPISVEVAEVPSIPSAGFTDGSKITINTADNYVRKILDNPDLLPKDVAFLTGVNYHELAHHLFTPRMDSPLARKVRSRSLWLPFNALEDQSAETKFVDMYEPATSYFTTVVADYLMSSDLQLEVNYALVSGREYLPESIREMFRSRFFDQSSVDVIDEIVAEYKQLWAGKDSERMLQLMKELNDILSQYTPHPPNQGAPVFGRISSHTEIKEGDPDREAAEMVRAKRERDQQEKRDEDDDESTASGGGSDSGDEQDDGDEEGSGSGDGSADSDGEDEEQDSSGSVTDQSGDDEGAGIGTGESEKDGTPQGSFDDASLKKALEETMEEILEDLDVEIGERIKNIVREETSYRVTSASRRDPVTQLAIDPAWHQIARRCQDELRRLQQDVQPGWVPNRRRGKLNPRAYARAIRGDEYVRRQWREGVHNAIDFEVVFLVDTSGSMGSHRNQSSVATWILRRMFDHFDSITTVLGFSYHTELIHQRGDRASKSRVPVFQTGGGTSVVEALREARRILSVSKAKQKLVVLVTDGQFADKVKAIELMNTLDATIMITGINFDVSEYAKYQQVVSATTISDPLELISLVRETALELVRRTLR